MRIITNHLRKALVTILLTMATMSFGCSDQKSPAEHFKPYRFPEEQKELNISLCRASFQGDFERVVTAIKSGANPNTSDCGEWVQTEWVKIDYKTPLFFALIGSIDKKPDQYRMVIRALLNAGANPNLSSNNEDKETPLMYAKMIGNGTDDSLEKLLVEGGADVNITSANGKLAKDYEPLTDQAFFLGQKDYYAKIEKVIFGPHRAILHQMTKEAKKELDLSEKNLVDTVLPKK